ncbi:MAG: ADP-ribosylglycohydrolase family protein [Verrucomicrobia bacterium]|nr:ADP-ribosylglycohydrolase family protein [Verrucomicrobiota bacterium]
MNGTLTSRDRIQGALWGAVLGDALGVPVEFTDRSLRQLEHFRRLSPNQLPQLPEHAIQSSGYVMDTLTASIWCLLNTRSYPEAVLQAVNLGEDTDTTGIATGGLAGLVYGHSSVPEAWTRTLARHADLEVLFGRFTTHCLQLQN